MARSPIRRAALIAILAALAAAPALAVVDIHVDPPKRSKLPDGERFVQAVVLANQVANYKLNYDITQPPDAPDHITSKWWVWTKKTVTLGLTEPTHVNWYWQGFFNWTFDGESLHNRRATLRVIRPGGADGVVEYTWDTPAVKATIRFAMTTGSDKLLMFGHYEPKREIKASTLRLSCYPATFATPRARAVTTARRTLRPGAKATLDLATERWVLYEDTKPNRPGGGSAGLTIGTPDAFQTITIPVAEYELQTRLDLKPGRRSFALALYSFPALPDLQQTRAYFRASGDREAAWLGRVAAAGLAKPMPPLPVPANRRDALQKDVARRFARPLERWQPDPTPLAVPWAKPLPGGPIRTVLFCPRWCAWETMELGRRLDLSVKNLFFDSKNAISGPGYPYKGSTGQGPIGLGPAASRAAALCGEPGTELFVCARITADAMPAVARTALLQQVRNGAGLLLTGSPGLVNAWPKGLFATPDPPTANRVLAALPLAHIPGFREGERGRAGASAPVAAYRYGKGRVVVLRANLAHYASLVPINDASEGLDGATDRCLALAAGAAMAAAGRVGADTLHLGPIAADATGIAVAIAPALPVGGTLLARVQDDLDRVLALRTVELPLPNGLLPLPAVPVGRRAFLDVVLRDAHNRSLAFASALLPAPKGPSVGQIALEPATQTHEAAVPRVELPQGGALRCRAVVRGPDLPAKASVTWHVTDAFGRLLARATSPVPADGAVAATLTLSKPVTVCHTLDVALVAGGRELAFARQRFAVTMPYPCDDFTALMWSYAGGEPLLRRNQRLCYDLGAEMMDLCHVGGYNDTGAAREYAVAARSGLRILPYVTRLAGMANPKHVRVPCLHDAAKMKKRCDQLAVTCRQAAPYSPAAFTLGDENYLFRGKGECCHSPQSIAAFRQWLKNKYKDIAALNRAWATKHRSFDAIERPMLLAEAAGQTASFAPWIDHKRFMDTTFAQAHEQFAHAIRRQAPGAKVGWDGFLGYNWRSGYDFTKLCANLELNQTYVSHWLQGELVRSFRRPDALSGKWGNAIADNAAGFAAWPWHGLFGGDNSVWWWTSWGCDYIPFNPDMSLADFGKWFFPAAREVAAGPGKLLLHARRDDRRIAVLYSQPDMFASAVFGELCPKAAFGSTGNFWRQHTGLLRGIKDLGHQFHHISLADLETGKLSTADTTVVVLSLASCLSDKQVAALRTFVEAGGTLVVDGRAGLLTGDGTIRAKRALDDLLGVTAPAGLAAIKQSPLAAKAALQATIPGPRPTTIKLGETSLTVWEPGLKLTKAKALASAGGAPVLAVNAIGKGRAITLNIALGAAGADRHKAVPNPVRTILGAVIASAGLDTPCTLTLPDGSRPVCIEQVLFADEAIRYLCLEQDLLARGLADQKARLTLPQPSIVYDLRAGKRVGTGKVAAWDLTLSRGRPLVYAILPYAVRAVDVAVPAAVKLGGKAEVLVGIETDGGRPGTHVVRMNVFAPGAAQPHRQYSQNIACPVGQGRAAIAFALNDTPGVWRIELRDVATGVATTRKLSVTN